MKQQVVTANSRPHVGIAWTHASAAQRLYRIAAASGALL